MQVLNYFNRDEKLKVYENAVDDVLNMYSLPSYAFPEVYNYMVEKKIPLVQGLNDPHNLYFDFDYVNMDDLDKFASEIKELSKKEGLYFQRKNNPVIEQERKIRRLEHEIATLEVKLKKEKEKLQELKAS